MVFIVQDTRGEGSRAVQSRACFLSSEAARKRQNMSSPEEALVTTTEAIILLSLWLCAGNFTPWKKVTSNNINCLYNPLVPLLLMELWQASIRFIEFMLMVPLTQIFISDIPPKPSMLADSCPSAQSHYLCAL